MSRLNVLIVGSGGREHALAWKIYQSMHLGELWSWPGNPVIHEIAKPLFSSHDMTLEALTHACTQKNIHLVICGPEHYLDQGLADVLERSGIPCFGPKARAAKLESSKAFAKNFMRSANIPTADFEIVPLESLTTRLCENYLKRWSGVVLKASGLAAGKGVFVCTSLQDIDEAIRRFNSQGMKHAAREIVIEKILHGRECSYFTFLGKSTQYRLGFAVDHKRLLAHDRGPNTGGMGCYTPVPWLPEDAGDRVDSKIVKPLLRQMQLEGLEYTGCLYVGLMWTEKGPYVVEFNVRLGDPEAQCLAVSDSLDWLPIFARCAGISFELSVSRRLQPTLCYVLASEGYPFGESTEQPACLPRKIFAKDVNTTLKSLVFAASVKAIGNEIQSGSGRVLNVLGCGDKFSDAKANALKEIEFIRTVWPSFQFRSDIGRELGDKSL